MNVRVKLGDDCEGKKWGHECKGKIGGWMWG